MIDHINAYVLIVKDLEKSVSFYRDKLGFELKDTAEGFAYFVFGSKTGPGVALIEVPAAANLVSEDRVTAPQYGKSSAYFAVFVQDVDKEYEELKGKGVKVVRPPTTHPWGQRIAYFEDPEGNLWEISHFLK